MAVEHPEGDICGSVELIAVEMMENSKYLGDKDVRYDPGSLQSQGGEAWER